METLTSRVVSRLLGLPAPTGAYTAELDLRIPMRDGVELLADHYAPAGDAAGTVLVRSPYGWRGVNSALYRAQFAAHGYHLLLVRCRGTFGSGGTWQPWRHEIDDGADTVAWLRSQPWFGGKLATVGNSYLGWTQWALLMDPPPELVTAVIQTAPHDFAQTAYSGGAFNLADWLGWSDQLAHQEDTGSLRALLRMITADRRQAPALSTLPTADAAERLCAGRAPWWRDWVSVRDLDDPFWTPMRLGAALERTRIPVLLQSGWQDVFLRQTKQQYDALGARGIEVGLTIGPWTHRQAGVQPMLSKQALAWVDRHLKGAENEPAAVRAYVTGAGQWREFPRWPDGDADVVLHPLPGGGLGEQRPSADALPARFTADPADPVPSIGGRLLGPAGGYRDDSALARRSDVLAFTGAPLTEPVEVTGVPWAELTHHTDNPEADLFVRISEVDSKGRSRNVSDGYCRLAPGRPDGPVRVELDPIAHRFRAGNRIRLLIAGAAHPRWERNLGTGDDPATSTRLAVSHRSIDLAGSALHLPVRGGAR